MRRALYIAVHCHIEQSAEWQAKTAELLDGWPWNTS
jgi:hypothetical protein